MQTHSQSKPNWRARAGAKRKPGKLPSTKHNRAPSPALVEGTVLRMATGLSVDSAKHPDTRRAHGTFLNGGISLALSLGLISEQRAMTLRNACSHLLDGAELPAQMPGQPVIGPADTDYVRVIVAVRRNGGASMDQPADVASLGVTGARKMLDRLRADGVIGEADMLGFSRVIVVEH
jgi:hypothetical protein